MKQKLVVMIAAVLILALTVSIASAEDQNDQTSLRSEQNDAFVAGDNLIDSSSVIKYGDPIGSYKNVTAYSNKGNGKYQCVEYVKRFYKEAMNVEPDWDGTGNAITYYTNAEAKGLVSYSNNGSVAPKPDDIIIFSPTDNGYGHVAIITEVGDKYIKIIEQNWNQENAFASLSLEKNGSKYYISPRGASKRPTEGWCRTPILNIISPTKKSFSLVGNYNNPNLLTVDAEVKSENVPITGLNKDNFTIEIGSKKVNDVTVSDVGEGKYKLSFNPPKQDSNGNYDLNVYVKYKKVTLSDSELNAVRYGEDNANANANVMLVIDRSGSMSGSPISSAKNSANLFIDYMEAEDMAGVVSFSSSARYDYHLATLTPEVKNSIKQKINSIYASGVTAIGSGMRYGLNDLLNYGDPNNPWAIVLLSDGYQNSGENPNNVIPSIKASNIQVYTVGLGPAVDQKLLGNIADQTGGKYYYSPTDSQLQEIYNDIVGKIIGWKTVFKRNVKMFIHERVPIAVPIDSAIDKVSFGIGWPGSNVDLVLYKPDGTLVDPSFADSDPTIEYLSGPTYKIYKVTDPESGMWNMELNATDMPAGGEDVYVTVLAESTLSMSLSTNKGQYNQGEVVKIIADLSDAGTQITGADVKVNVTLPDSSVEYLTLYDDGGHGDNGSQDGVYANYLVDTSLMGDYKVDVTSTGSLSDGSQFKRIEDTSFEIIQGISSISSIANLQSTNDITWINWTWTNPTGPNFSHTEIYLDGVFQANTSAEFFNATGLEPETEYTLSTHTVDISGNVNETWVNSTATTSAELVSDVKKPVIDSVNLFPANTTAGATINLSINATDDTAVTEVIAGDIQLIKTDDIWQGSITAPSSIGSYSLLIKAKDAAGNVAEASVPYRVVQLSGGANIAVSPRSSSIVAGNSVTLNIKVKNTQNIDDIFKVNITVSELPAANQANIDWFSWTEQSVKLRAGEEILLPLEVEVPDGTALGLKLFRANVNSETSVVTGFDTGYLKVV
ncbi:VWA domain-containing protein [Methanosarcina mazei]|uniref:Calcium-activated chloride channel protein 1 n=2 Tax=Methanosarcina mazei TaxID=2209 RepID=A0A0E3LSN7_METMZ|nr:VWA domain-containing protein [Methanosarcina mazei]AAM32174.1 putative chloride channel [Methanosarcina mazei Go1]AKB62091.1 calcium-activated chloride channel protein 1 [Methanosarcina mazei SarPi]WIM45888.1 VWA domain-containing protein [Methanosarcina mazei]